MQIQRVLGAQAVNRTLFLPRRGGSRGRDTKTLLASLPRLERVSGKVGLVLAAVAGPVEWG